ncbi:MAG: hypothetical protein QM781_07755 [Chitinophagaceae bacterium]
MTKSRWGVPCFLLNLFLSVINFTAMGQDTWQSAWVQEVNGTLKYKEDAEGNRIPDFSRVGYRQGTAPLPQVPVAIMVAPNGNNDREIIQSAIDELSRRRPDKDGLRGAILLKKGIWKIDGTIRITTSGIVLRGEGEETRLIATSRQQHSLILAQGKGAVTEITGTRQPVQDDYVPTGATMVRVARPEMYKPGDAVILFRPGTAAWISDLKMDQIETRDSNTKQWRPAEYDLHFERRVLRVEGHTVVLDNPVMMPLQKKYGGAYLYKYSFEGRIRQVGIEDLRCESEYSNDTDEAHGWNAITLNRIEDAWVKQVTARYFGFACVNLGDNSRQVTVLKCRSLDPKSQITGGRRYSFNNDGQLNLFLYCSAADGRHDYVTGARVCGPNVFYASAAMNAHADIGPHHRWAVGTLYDNIVTDGEINVQDRGNWGTGHGWAGVTQVIWNCRARAAAIQQPWVSGVNYAIGLQAAKVKGRLTGRPDGVWEGQNKPGLIPASLFRLQAAGLHHPFEP